MAGDLSDSQFVAPAASPPSPGSGLPYPPANSPLTTNQSPVGLSPTAVSTPPASPPAKVSFAEDPTTRPPKLPPSSSSGRTSKRTVSPIVAGIAVFLLLIAGLGAGLYVLTSQPRFGEIRRQAEVCTQASIPTGNCNDCGWENQGQCGVGDSDTCNCNPGNAPCDPPFEPNGAGGCRAPATPTPPGGGLTGNCPPDPVAWCATFDCPNGDTDRDGTCNPSPHDGLSGDTGATYTSQSGNNCPQPSSGCGQVDKYNSGTPGVDWDAYCGHSFINFTNCQTSAPTATPRPSRTPTPTPTSEPAGSIPQCREVFAQVKDPGGGWVDAPNNDLAAVAAAGDQVRFVVRGSASSGAFTRAAFFINGAQHIDDVVQISPKKFAVEYTLPDSGGQIEVEAVLFHDSQGWVD